MNEDSLSKFLSNFTISLTNHTSILLPHQRPNTQIPNSPAANVTDFLQIGHDLIQLA
jgi:hypothetical protein